MRDALNGCIIMFMKITPNSTTKNGSEIFIVDNLHPEATAMAQALYSRDPKSVTEHIEKIEQIGWQKFMDTYYVGYGHKSIGDCGSTTLFIENISILAAKAIQDWQLYKGQEASTRYLDMSKQKIINPFSYKDTSGQSGAGDASGKGDEINQKWMDFYNKVLAVLIPHFKEKYPRHEEEKESVYDKAIKAKAFDIARGFLPAGITTYASWHTDLRQAHDHLKHLEHHPLDEMREIGGSIREALKSKYASSFGYKTYDEQEAYYDKASSYTFFDTKENCLQTGFTAKSALDITGLKNDALELLTERPQKTELPAKLAKYGSITFSFPLDFGSFRDLQRHRNGVCEMPLLSTKHGFLPWYLEQLTPELRDEAVQLIEAQSKAIESLDCDTASKQYFTALGFAVACEVTYGLPQTLYVAELRSGQTVHPTLRVVAQQMAKYVNETIPECKTYADMSEDEWNIKRGTQDIVKK